MATSEVRELQVVGEINHNIELYNLDELISEDEISEGVDTLRELGKEFRHLHVELQSQLGSDYAGNYPHYGKTANKVTNYLKQQN